MAVAWKTGLEPERECPFADSGAILQLACRESPYWHALFQCRHIGIYRPQVGHATWTARVLDAGKRYKQKAIGIADPTRPGAIGYQEALQQAFAWFELGERAGTVHHDLRPKGRTKDLKVCPIGQSYTVAHALRDYFDWSRLARSSGSTYNNLVLVNHHIPADLMVAPLEGFSARHLREIAIGIVENPPSRGFSRPAHKVSLSDLEADELRRRKRTFNSIVSILRVAFQHAWDSGFIESDRPWRCLKRISVHHTPRLLFLNRAECGALIAQCRPALRALVLAALYSGCRVGELARLRVEDVGFQVYGLRIAAFKRSPARYVFLPDEGMAFFLACCEGKSAQDLVFLSEKGFAWQRQHTSQFRTAVRKTALPRSFVFHGLRHTYASDLIREGVPLDIVARQLGHSDSRTVANTYGHLAEHFREDQIRSRFSPLLTDYQVEAALRRTELDELWRSVQPGQWRDYGSGFEQTSHPSRSRLRTDTEILRVFGV